MRRTFTQIIKPDIEKIIKTETGQMVGSDAIAYRNDYTNVTAERATFLWFPTKIDGKWYWMRRAVVLERKIYAYYQYYTWDYRPQWYYDGVEWIEESYRLLKEEEK